ncbi:hypothetical protein, partial [Helicobacter typhlonius]|uniref:hypothetical protein n=1 Tax=Helicobacter typhlonius TaxID=76936 RepID=UPI002FE1B559
DIIQNIRNTKRDSRIFILCLESVFKTGSKVRVIVVIPVAAIFSNKSQSHPKYKIAQVVPNKIVIIHSIKYSIEKLCFIQHTDNKRHNDKIKNPSNG